MNLRPPFFGFRSCGACLLILAYPVLGACRSPEQAAVARVAPPLPETAERAPIAVRVAGDRALLEAVHAGDFFRWVAPRHPELRIEVGAGQTFLDAAAGAEIGVSLLPVPAAFAAAATGLPVRFEPDAFSIGGERYTQSAHVLTLRLPAPPGREAGRWLVVGRERAAIAAGVDDLLIRLTGTSRRKTEAPADFEVRETQWLARRGRFVASGTPGEMAIDPASDDDAILARTRALAGAGVVASGRVSLRGISDDSRRAEWADLAADLDRSLSAMAARIPYHGDLAFEIAVEPDYAAEARANGAVGEAVEGRRTDLALVFDSADRHAYRFALARRLLARAGLADGARALPPGIIDGAALWLSGGWYGRAYGEWLTPLARAGAFPAAAELLAPTRPEDGSRLLAAPVAAAWVESRAGKTLRQKLSTDLPANPALDRELRSLRAAANRISEPASAGPARAAAWDGAAVPFLRGVSFAMLNSIDGGYHAPGVATELSRLATLGADAVSLMPFAYQRDAHGPRLAFLDDHPSSETDIGLLHAARRAHAQGFSVLWKPHIWVSEGSWPGEIEMRDEATWSLWWSAYRRYVLHHALLAAWARADIFCLGVELDRTVTGPERERAWRELIASVRVLFPGPLTYAANWDRAPEVPFWDALDFVGVDAYYPLASGDQATDADLAAGAAGVVRQLEHLAKTARRPLLLTEVGFPARRAAWREPHSEAGEYEEEDQLRSYRALFGALGRRPWLAGVFLWKAFSDEAGAGGRHGGRADFRFLNRRAEAAVRDYFALGAPGATEAAGGKGTP